MTDALGHPQVWSQWDEDSAWTHSLLTTFQTSFPRRHQEEDSEEQISKKLSAYQVRGAFLPAFYGTFPAHQGAGPVGTLIQTKLVKWVVF